MPAGAIVGGVEDRLLEKALAHRPASGRRACQPWNEQGVIEAIGSSDDPPAAAALTSGTGNSVVSMHLKEAFLRHNRSICRQESWAYALGA